MKWTGTINDQNLVSYQHLRMLEKRSWLKRLWWRITGKARRERETIAAWERALDGTVAS